MVSEAFIAGHLDRLPGHPKLIGLEYATKGGIIDILAEDETGAYVVVEVKSGTVNPWGCLQLLRYCGAMIENVESLNLDKPVKGVLIGRELDKIAKLIFMALPSDKFKFTSLDEIFPEGIDAAS